MLRGLNESNGLGVWGLGGFGPAEKSKTPSTLTWRIMGSCKWRYKQGKRILSHFMGLITPLLTPHEAPSNSKPLRHLTLQDVFWTFPCFRVEGFRVEGFRV